MENLLVSTVFCPSELNDFWIKCQKEYLEKTTENYDYQIFTNRLADNLGQKVLGKLDIHGPISEQHSTCLNAIIEKFKQTNHDYYLILDSDCFPIKKNWLPNLIQNMGDKEVAAVVRFENLTAFPHPAAMLIKRSALEKDWFDMSISHQVNLINDPVYDPCMLIPLNKIYPLVRTNAKNYHPIFAGIYGYSFYHHGCGSRESHYHSEKYHWGYKQHHNNKSLFHLLKTNPDAFFEDLQTPQAVDIKSKDEELKKLLNSDEWPDAVNPELICDQNNPSELRDRADIILWEIVGDVENKKFLDFGCGLGYAVQAAAETAELAVGYDINQNFHKTNKDNAIWTTDKEEIIKNGPYDSILLYDVLDHCENIDETMQFIKKVKSENGKVYCRCHPISSRHASHLYTSINKAFVQLVFTYEELEEMGYKTNDRTILPSYFPLKTYRELFQRTGFAIEFEEITKQPPEPFFKEHPIIRQRIVKRWMEQDPVFKEHEFPSFQMEQSFIDYVLK